MGIELDSKETAILFAVLFVVVGYVAPIVFATYVPSDYYLEINDFQAENAVNGDVSHQVCLDRDVKNGQTGTIFTELYLLNGKNGERVEVGSMSSNEYFEEGSYKIEATMVLPEAIEAGEYRYVLVIEITPAQGRVTRQIEHTSDKFTVYENRSDMQQSNFSCS
jgi:hypothetical protein